MREQPRFGSCQIASSRDLGQTLLGCLGPQCPVLSRCASLKSLRLTQHHSLRGLNLSRLIALQELTLSYNSRLTTLDTRGCSKLKDLSCTYHESLTSLNVSGCTALQRIVCGSNPVLRQLRICGCSKLRSIGAEHCQLGELDTSFCPSLVEVPSPSQW